MSFQITRETKEGHQLIRFSGQVDEEAKFPEKSDLGAKVFIDLAGVTAINSIGIRSWILWFSQYPNTHFTFLNSPKALVMQMNMVEGFLPEQAEVLSMQVPFYCETCDEEKDVLFELGKQVKVSGDSVKLDYKKSEICKPDCEIELDVTESKFFRFLFNKNSKAA